MTIKQLSASEVVNNYHQQTKHYLDRPANSLGYMDWQNQPIPFRSYQGATQLQLPVFNLVDNNYNKMPYSALYLANKQTISPISLTSIATMLSLSMGLSAWKKYGNSEWALRINPSSGNLHPTECYLLLPSLSQRPACLTHYHPYIHVLEEIAYFQATPTFTELSGFGLILTSIAWREAWKYGERAYRYCQHDVGHALAALRIACNLNGWKMTIIPQLTPPELDQLLAIDKVSEEDENADCLCWISINEAEPEQVANCIKQLKIFNQGHAPNQLSRDHIDWEIIKRVQQAVHSTNTENNDLSEITYLDSSFNKAATTNLTCEYSAQEIIFNRRSAQSYQQSKSTISFDAFMQTLHCTLANNNCPFDVFPYMPQVHLAIFVHAVDGLDSGLYLFVRNPLHLQALQQQSDKNFLWQQVQPQSPLYLLHKGNYRNVAKEISCDQEIASESAFSLGMIARFEQVIKKQPCHYPRLFWETGLIGQVLYLQAEAFNLRGTGIGCFFDDQMHKLLGLQTNQWQSLYHFTIGKPREDSRIETKAPYYHLQRED